MLIVQFLKIAIGICVQWQGRRSQTFMHIVTLQFNRIHFYLIKFRIINKVYILPFVLISSHPSGNYFNSIEVAERDR